MLYLFWYDRKKNTSMKVHCQKQKDQTKTFKFFIHRGTLNKTLGILITFLILTFHMTIKKRKHYQEEFIM